MFYNRIFNSFKLSLLIALAAISTLLNTAASQDDDCEVEVTFTWTLDSDWCESWCKVRNTNNQVVAGYFSACQNQGCSVCNINHLYAWSGSIDANLTNGVYIITQTITLPGGDYTIEMHDGYGDGWSDNPSEGLNALTIEGNIIYHIDFTHGYLTTGEITLSCDPNIEGCMDITACNYNSNAIADDGSCLYFDACGICDGPGIPDGDCDCLGNVLDAVGECGGSCIEDADNDGICDDCIGVEDECGVCNGPGAIYDCGCSDIPDGDCDCNGNVLDAIGECGGDCASDSNNNGICDDSEVLGCMDLSACNYDTLVNIDDGSCEYCSCIGGGDYTLTVEASPATHVAGITYKFYINMVNDNDHLSAVFGDSSAPWSISAPNGVFNSAYNSSWSAEGINPAFLNFFPEIADDTYATIGLDTPANLSGMPGAADPSIVEDANQLISPFFMQNGQTQLTADSFTGSTYFVLNTATNGKPNEDMRVFIMQITTTGSLSGVINYQIFINGIGSDEIIRTAVFDGVGTFDQDGASINPSCGCTDPTACNYDPEAIADDGSCLESDVCGECDGPGAIYECGCADIPEGDCDCYGNVLDALGECGGSCEADADADGICDDVDPCVGEYDACGECDGPGAIYECGCADIPEGDCDCDGNVLDALGECGGSCEADIDEDGICDDVDPCVGVYDECGVCNGPGAIYECGCADIPEGDCDCYGNVLDALGECGGSCEADIDEDGICDDVDPCVGEYDECGVCNGPGAIYECGCADIPEGDCDCYGNVLDALGECGGSCEADIDEDGICDDVDSCVGEYDECGVCNGPGAIYECGCADIPEGDCDCYGNVLDAVGECGGDCTEDINNNGICDDEEIGGCTDLLACNYNPFASENDGSCDYSCYGCTVTFACNYDPEATLNNGTCILPGDPCNDGDSWTVGDFLQSDCSCVGYGCTDPDACNYVEGAVTNNALCNYADTYVISGPLTSYLGMEVTYVYPETEGSAFVWSIEEGEILSGDGTSSVNVIWWGNWQGTLCVQEFNMYECTSDIACVNVNIVNSIEEQGIGEVNIFPNPARHELFIEFDRSNNYHIELIDILGKTILSEQVYNSTKLDVSEIERGVYFINASNGLASDTYKVIIH